MGVKKILAQYSGKIKEIQPRDYLERYGRWASWDTQVGTTTINSSGVGAPASQGTIGSKTFNSYTVFRSQCKAVTYLSAATAGSAAGVRGSSRVLHRGSGANQGGFFFVMRFAVPTTATGWTFFCGVCQLTTAITGTSAPSTQIESVAVTKDTGDTNFYLSSNDTTGTGGNKVDTGITPDVDTFYTVKVWCEPNDTTVYISLEDMQTQTVFTQAFSTKLPANTSQLSYQLMMGNNTTAAAVKVEFGEMYHLTPY